MTGRPLWRTAVPCRLFPAAQGYSLVTHRSIVLKQRRAFPQSLDLRGSDVSFGIASVKVRDLAVVLQGGTAVPCATLSRLGFFTAPEQAVFASGSISSRQPLAHARGSNRRVFDVASRSEASFGRVNSTASSLLLSSNVGDGSRARRFFALSWRFSRANPGGVAVVARPTHLLTRAPPKD